MISFPIHDRAWLYYQIISDSTYDFGQNAARDAETIRKYIQRALPEHKYDLFKNDFNYKLNFGSTGVIHDLLLKDHNGRTYNNFVDYATALIQRDILTFKEKTERPHLGEVHEPSLSSNEDITIATGIRPEFATKTSEFINYFYNITGSNVGVTSKEEATISWALSDLGSIPSPDIGNLTDKDAQAEIDKLKKEIEDLKAKETRLEKRMKKLRDDSDGIEKNMISYKAEVSQLTDATRAVMSLLQKCHKKEAFSDSEYKDALANADKLIVAITSQ